MDGLRRILARPWLVRAAQVGIGVVLAWAGLAKIVDQAGFAAQVHNFKLVPIAVENLIAMTLPWVELVTAHALIFGVRARAGAVLASGLVGVFTLAVLAALARGMDIECGCFGTGDASRVGWIKLGQNLAMLAVAVVGTLRPR
ncbi:MAG TPA: MauE/DoxX family redox-associated membrane protein [Candidatus Polarisedimenticolaceae bacterium]|nr:MauE/DoxX family redox-associated membrane protein [Candidatus Polarisedimenticolaceae bacterium]